jgi:hypothetical protein
MLHPFLPSGGGQLRTVWLLLAVVVASAAPSQGEERVLVPRVDRPPTLDDFVAGRPRQAEARIDAFTQREPGDGIAASQRTVAYLSYDADHLYVVFVCLDAEPARLRARRSPREAIGADDQVVLLLDTFRDRRRAYGGRPRH